MAWIDPRKSFAYFTANYKIRPSTKGWYLFDCPLCGGTMTRAVHFKYAVTKCFKPCAYNGDIIGYVAYVEDSDYDDAKSMLWRIEPSLITAEDLIGAYEEDITKIGSLEVTLPDGFTPILDGKDSLAIRARRYLSKRGFDLEELNREGFGYCVKEHEEFNKNFFGYIIVPFKRAGKLIYYIGRSFIGHDEFRYKNPPTDYVGIGKSDVIFNEEAIHLYREVFTTEGWSDAKTIGKKGTATLGWSLSALQKRLYMTSQCKRLVFIPDAGRDKGSHLTFYQKATQLAVDFLDTGKEIFVVDLNGLGKGKDVNELGRDAVMEQYRNHTPKLTWSLAMEILTEKNAA